MTLPPLLITAVVGAATSAASPRPAPIVWSNLLPEENATSNIPTYRNTMPIGNGRVAANAVIERDNATLTLLISSQEAFAESGEIMKVGWLRLRMVRANLSLPYGLVEQKLDPATATFSATFEDGVELSVYAHAHVDTFVLQASSPSELSIEVLGELVRPTPVDNYVPIMSCDPYNVSADEVVPAEMLSDDAIGWFHRNANSTYLSQVAYMENFELPQGYVDTLMERQTGLVVFPDRSRHRPAMLKPPGRPLVLASDGPSHTWTIGATVVTQEAGSEAAWLAKARKAIGSGLPSHARHIEYWDQFWNQSHILLCGRGCGNDTEQAAVSSQYALQRYIQALQARRHRFPIKFNGMLFTAQLPPNEDYRFWGSLNWWQNLRMPYYNMLSSGDVEMLQTLIDGFVANMPIAVARTRAYWPNMTQPALFFSEYTHPLFGTTHPRSYGCDRHSPSSSPISALSPNSTDVPMAPPPPSSPPPSPPPFPDWYSEDIWNGYNHQGALDMSLFALDLYAYTGNASRLSAALPLVDAILSYYAQRWPTTAEDGTMFMWPTQGLETWQCPGFPPPPAGDNCPANDMPTVAGLHKVVERALALVPTEMSSVEQRARWKALLAKVPPLPVNGSALRPCAICPDHTRNQETAELYAIHPYRLFGAGRATNLTLALNAWTRRGTKSNVGWSQDAMNAAMLGLANESANMVVGRATTPPPKGYRFPIFAPGEGDYEPSADHYAVMSNALTYMLIQSLDDADETIAILPAWPCRWDVQFKVHGPKQTVITGELLHGALVGELQVTPESRRKDVKVMACQGPVHHH